MSRTDVHAPAWVKERDPAWRSCFKESHNHSWHIYGYEKRKDRPGLDLYKPIWKRVDRCDLDVYLAARGWVRTACQIVYAHRGRNIFCGCGMCTGKDDRKLGNRSDRQRTKRLIRSGRWDEDMVSQRGRCRY